MNVLRTGTLELRYGPHASQCADVHLPDGRGPHPVVVLLHGGLWRASEGSAPMRPLARHLVRNGFAVLNLEYRRLGEAGAGWPGTFLDAVEGVNLAGRPLRAGPDARATAALDADRIAIVGHCSGGHLALWAAAWLSALGLPGRTGPARPGSVRLAVRTVVALAGITDLRAAEREGLDLPDQRGGPPAAAALLGGGQDAVAGRYRLGSPLDLLPVGREVAQLLVHGDADEVVPVEHAVRYARTAAQVGDRVLVARFPGMGHFDMLDPAHEAWKLTVRHLRVQLSN
jgi:acetyl esterase/lipase